ncbi:hypothetical protein FHP25_31275 [Vineibacter terrae]|uniref:Uncharacterized protein n=1 Tax=Vineibacter terrae TaxID=2586908 RepID=A0A5C8PDJ0_9HYPH|nr:hypothetical protein [Vineibacter terrae]TXL71192.1 hypothetical protein FHP25_31275 [Vineibacter terrae]
MSDTVIWYTYRRSDKPYSSKIAVQGPVWMEDDGRLPIAQAKERCMARGDYAVEAWRGEAPKGE